MISLVAVSKSFGNGASAKIVLNRVDLELPVDRKLALIGPRGSGKTTLIRLLAGLEQPSAGKVERRAVVSLPVGHSRGFDPRLSARQNAEFFARCQGADPAEVADFVAQVAGMDSGFDRPMREMEGEMRVRFAFALSYGVPCDLYLVDNVPAAGGGDFRKRCMAMFEERARTAGILFATSNLAVVRQYCDAAVLIADGKVTLHDDVSEAIGRLKAMERAV